MAGPRYKARSELQTRLGSDEELEAMPDHAATALDRPVASEADIKQAQLKQDVERGRRAREAAEKRRKWTIVAGLAVVTLALFFGSVLGAYLAFR